MNYWKLIHTAADQLPIEQAKRSLVFFRILNIRLSSWRPVLRETVFELPRHRPKTFSRDFVETLLNPSRCLT